MSACRRISNTSSPAPGLTAKRGRSQFFGKSEPSSGSRRQGPPLALPLPAGPNVVLTSVGGTPPSTCMSTIGVGGKSVQGSHCVGPLPPRPPPSTAPLPPVARLPPVAPTPPSTPPVPVPAASGLNPHPAAANATRPTPQTPTRDLIAALRMTHLSSGPTKERCLGPKPRGRNRSTRFCSSPGESPGLRRPPKGRAKPRQSQGQLRDGRAASEGARGQRGRPPRAGWPREPCRRGRRRFA